MPSSPEISSPELLAPSSAGRHRQPPVLLTAATVAVLALLVLLAQLMLPSPAAHAVPPSSVSVTDTTGEVDPEILEGELAGVDFRREVTLVVLVLDVTDYGYTRSQDTALNDAVLAHARDSAPELLSAEGTHFAEGTVILALDPSNRFLGSYAGEDVKLAESGFESVQEAMRDDAGEGSWDEALMAGAEKYAGLLDRPWWRHPGAILPALAAVGAAVIWVISLLAMRRSSRRRVDEALPRYEDVLAMRLLTDSAARSLPDHSPYAQAALRDHETYLQELSTAEELHARLPAPSQRGWAWGLKAAQRSVAKDFHRTVTSLDAADDAIIATHDLLHRIGGWRESWEQELQPLRDSIDALDGSLFSGEDVSAREAAAAADVRELGGTIALELESLTADLVADRIDPDSALERLDTLTRELSAAVARLRDGRISHLAADDDEREVLHDAAEDVEDTGYRSVRGRRHQLEHGSAGSADLFWSLSPVLWYSSWHHDSDTALETHRNPPSSSGSSSGFSSGGFSGAGSSSRF